MSVAEVRMDLTIHFMMSMQYLYIVIAEHIHRYIQLKEYHDIFDVVKSLAISLVCGGDLY